MLKLYTIKREQKDESEEINSSASEGTDMVERQRAG